MLKLKKTILVFSKLCHKHKLATLDEYSQYTSVLAEILSDISDDNDTNFIYIVSEQCQQQIRKNNGKNTLKQTKHQTKSQFTNKNYVLTSLSNATFSFLIT